MFCKNNFLRWRACQLLLGAAKERAQGSDYQARQYNNDCYQAERDSGCGVGVAGG